MQLSTPKHVFTKDIHLVLLFNMRQIHAKKSVLGINSDSDMCSYM